MAVVDRVVVPPLVHQWGAGGEARAALEQARLVAPDAVDPVVWLAALEVRERGDTAAARRRLEAALTQVNAQTLVARVLQSFPELERALPQVVRARVGDFSLREAYGDSALMHLLRAQVARQGSQRASHLDSASGVLTSRLTRDTLAFAAYRLLATVRLAQGRPQDAVVLARRSLTLMPPSQDAHAAMQALAVLAQAEAALGARDSARVHLRQLLEQPSVVTAALVAVDSTWRAVARRSP